MDKEANIKRKLLQEQINILNTIKPNVKEEDKQDIEKQISILTEELNKLKEE